MQICIGIPSWLPDSIQERQKRIARLNNLLLQVEELFKLPIIFIAQNWKDFTPQYNGKLHIYHENKLGILKARQLLRKKFLELNYDYIIMMDDDCIIECTGNANELYINELEKHPQGFCFIKGPSKTPYNQYAPAQLNLCAISRYIYEQESIPNIDPQKGEGFEDTLFASLLHYKYADKEFDAPKNIKHVQFLQRDVKSTWSGEQHYNWTNLRQRTKDIEKYIAINRELPPKIDLVVPYVDSTDKNWQMLFNKYNPIKNRELEGINAKNRFRSEGDFFRFFFRCIEVNIPWINKIHLLVQSQSQVPNWINKNKVHIVLHEQFIPKEYLPTFNSGTIEMFLHKIPELAEHFLYANDDIFAISHLDITDYFSKDKLYFNLINVDRSQTEINSRPWYKMCQNNHDLIFNTKNAIPYLIPDHSFRPYLKSQYKTCYEKYQAKIKNSITQFRDSKNLTCYLFSLYLKLINKYNNNGIKEAIASSTTKNITSLLESKDTVCINDTEASINIYADNDLRYWFKNKFDQKSSYETTDLPTNFCTTPKPKEKDKDIRADGYSNCYLYF